MWRNTTTPSLLPTARPAPGRRARRLYQGVRWNIDISDFEQGQQDYGKYNGVTYGLTLSTEPMILWYRKDIYEKLGLKPAATWEEYKSNAQKIEEAKAGDGAMFGWGSSASWWWMTLVWSFGGKLYDENFVPQVNSAEAVEATQFFKDMMAYAPRAAFPRRAMTSPTSSLRKISAPLCSTPVIGAWRWTPPTTPSSASSARRPCPRARSTLLILQAGTSAFRSDAKNKDEAWKFMEFVLGKSNSVAYLKAGAAAIGRKSISTNEELLKLHPYLPLLNIPTSSRIERYPQIRTWPEVEKAIIDAMPAMLNGEVEIKAGLDKLNETLTPILAQEKGN